MFGIDDALIGAGISAIGSFLGGERRNAAQAEQAAQANQFSAEQYASRYQTTVKDMQAAGLNPMLAYSQGPGTSPTGQQASIQDSVTPAIGQFNQYKVNSATAENLQASARKLNAEANVTEQFGVKQAEADYQRTLAATGLSTSQAAKVMAETDNAIAQLNNIRSENERIKRATQLLYEQSNLTFQQQLSETQRYDMLKAQAKLMIAQTGLANLDIDAAKALDNIGRESAQLKPIADILRAVIGMSRR